MNNYEDRPWGRFYILSDDDKTKVKKLIVNPGQRLSLQSHKFRDEHWIVISGMATVTLNDEVKNFNYGEHIFVPKGTRHRISCTGLEPVEIIEVQTGSNFAEEDIVRYEDDYQRN